MPETLSPNWVDQNIDAIAARAPLQRLRWSVADSKQVTLWLRRDDQLHPALGGNKVYKLVGFLRRLLPLRANHCLASFGGAYSNHLYALAAAGQILNVPTVGVVRGERPPGEAPTLSDLEQMGMQLHFVSRADYRRRDEPAFRHAIQAELGIDCNWIPEGGNGPDSQLGCHALGKAIAAQVALCDGPVSAVVLPAGTGATALGVAASLGSCPVWAMSMVKGGGLQSPLADTGSVSGTIRVIDAHLGGFGKVPTELVAFILEFERETGVPLDPVYTGKMMYRLAQMLEQGAVAPGNQLLLVHTGGLQGRRSIEALRTTIDE